MNHRVTHLCEIAKISAENFWQKLHSIVLLKELTDKLKHEHVCFFIELVPWNDLNRSLSNSLGSPRPLG